MPYDKELLEPPEEVKKEENTLIENKQEVVSSQSNTDIALKDEYKDAILENQKALEQMASQAEEVLSSASDMAINGGRHLDVEAYSLVLKASMELQEKIVAIKEKRLKKPEVKGESSQSPKNITQNNIIIKSTRELNNILRNINAENIAKENNDSKDIIDENDK